jgi:nitroreductase
VSGSAANARPAGVELAAAIRSRRSVGRVLSDPLPRDLVEELLADAVRAPNHHLTEPWRFVVLAGDARRALGAAHAAAVARARPDHPPAGLAKEAARLERAPVVVACIVRPSAHPAAEPAVAREDRDAVAAAVQNLLLSAHARGLGAMWRTGVMVDEDEVRAHLGLGPHDAVVAFVYLGWPAEEPAEPTPRRPLSDVVEWRGSG